MIAYQWTDHYLSIEESKCKKLIIKKISAKYLLQE